MKTITKLLILTISVLMLSACSSKRVRVNGLICPEGYSTPQQAEKDLTQCNYYDEKAAAKASKSPLKPACKKCLEDKGYELE